VKPKHLVITIGDPAGVGPEVVLKSLASLTVPPAFIITVIGTIELMQTVATLPQYPWLSYLDIPSGQIRPGQPGPSSGQAALSYLERAIQLLLSKEADGIVTAPVSKRFITACGHPFLGHTEYLATSTYCRYPVMTFISNRLRVGLVTTHVPLRKVPGLLNPERIVRTVQVSADGLRRYFGLVSPRFAVCGLNPHAGEGGLLGDEDQRIIAPSVELIRRSGLACEGPLPADSLFKKALQGEYDMIIALYHDQALAPIKTLDPDPVHITLGLPFVRTSVSHGTAFELAGKSIASAQSMLRAIQMAIRMLEADPRLF
jgi:4-hydroxythreonine-4-phosphate dehydrogenase